MLSCARISSLGSAAGLKLCVTRENVLWECIVVGIAVDGTCAVCEVVAATVAAVCAVAVDASADSGGRCLFFIFLLASGVVELFNSAVELLVTVVCARVEDDEGASGRLNADACVNDVG